MRGLSPSPKIMTGGLGATTEMLAHGANPAMVLGMPEKAAERAGNKYRGRPAGSLGVSWEKKIAGERRALELQIRAASKNCPIRRNFSYRRSRSCGTVNWERSRSELSRTLPSSAAEAS